MRRGWLAVVVVALWGCAEGGGARVAARGDCTETAECPRGRTCVNNLCVLGPVDAAPPVDAEVDAQPDGAAPEDATLPVLDAAPDATPVEDAAPGDDGAPADDAGPAGPDAAEPPCQPGARRDCGRSVGLCRRGTQSCGDDRTWGPCEGGVQPTDEVCNLADDDCNGVVDDGFGVGDACDGVGACGEGVVECRNTIRTRCSTDPGGSQDASRVETCNGEDDDCDGMADEGLRVGGDCEGMCGPGDLECDDAGGVRCSTDPGGSDSVPRAEVCNGRDDDCNGMIDDTFELGAPCDGEGACGAGVRECDDAGGVRCSSDADGSASQAIDEACNAADDDCDGTIDEGFDLGAACDGEGACGAGVLECDAQGRILCSTDPGGSMSGVQAEACNEADDDCDGAVDEGLNLGAACPGVGRCPAGVLACGSDASVVCSTFPGGPDDRSRDEVCDGADDDCDGTADEGFDLGMACMGLGACGSGVAECDAAGGARCSTAPGGSEDASGPEACNGVDDDCDGTIDEDGGCGGDTCETAPPMPPDAVVTGNSAQLENDYGDSTCVGQSPGRDQVFRLDVPAAGRYAVAVAPTGAGFDPMFWVTSGSDCAPASVRTCLSGRALEGEGRPEARLVDFLRGDTFYLVVDGRGDLAGGPFVATAQPVARGETCGTAIPLTVPAQFPGTTEGRGRDLAGQQCPAGTLTTGPEQVFRLDLEAAASLRITVLPAAMGGPAPDPVIYVTNDCVNVDVGCAGGRNAAGAGAAETLDVDLDAGTWFVVVDHPNNAGGAFLLEITER
jgi:hypothetical protein